MPTTYTRDLAKAVRERLLENEDESRKLRAALRELDPQRRGGRRRKTTQSKEAASVGN